MGGLVLLEAALAVGKEKEKTVLSLFSFGEFTVGKPKASGGERRSPEIDLAPRGKTMTIAEIRGSDTVTGITAEGGWRAPTVGKEKPRGG